MFYFLILIITTTSALARPISYTDLLKYVQLAPDQGKTGTCLYVASTGAMELLSNKKNDIQFPLPGGQFDLAESFLIHAPAITVETKIWLEKPIYRFNRGFGIHISSWPFDPWDDGEANQDVWTEQMMDEMQKVSVPKIKTELLFEKGTRYSTNVLNEEDIIKIREYLWKYQSPVVVNYNDNNYWHVILIVGYDSRLNGDCYQISKEDCNESLGSFYVRDSFGPTIEIRDYDWLRVKGNAAYILTEHEN